MVPVHVQIIIKHQRNAPNYNDINDICVVVLKDDINNRWLPIYVGPLEAQSIAMGLEKIKALRPLTHDLIKNFFDMLNINVNKIVVTDLIDNVFFAKIHFTLNDIELEMDSRPSDAIAIALRTNAPIFVEEQVLNAAGIDAATSSIENVSQIILQNAEQTLKQNRKPNENKHEKVLELEEKLNEAVINENYEEAAKLRDRINKLKSQE